MSIDLEYAIKKDIRNNPVVREVDLAQKRDFLRGLGFWTVLVGMLLFAAWQHYRVVQGGYDLEALRRQQAAAEVTNQHLRLQLETDRRPQEIERRAVNELRMVRPTEHETIVLERTRAASPRANVVARAR